MGSFRGRLIGALAALPGPAFAEVCDKVRPEWSPTDGPVSALGEVKSLLLSPPGFFFALPLALALAATLRPRRWLLALCTGAALIVAGLLIGGDSEIMAFARAEGCVGPPGLTYALLAALPLPGLWRLMRR